METAAFIAGSKFNIRKFRNIFKGEILDNKPRMNIVGRKLENLNQEALKKFIFNATSSRK